MANKKWKPLLLRNDFPVRSIEDLQTYFDIKRITHYYHSGELAEWLNTHYYEELYQKVMDISPSLSEDDLKAELYLIFNISTEEAIRSINERNDRRAREETKRKIKEEAERKAREEAERKARAKAQKEAERKIRKEMAKKSGFKPLFTVILLIIIIIIPIFLPKFKKQLTNYYQTASSTLVKQAETQSSEYSNPASNAVTLFSDIESKSVPEPTSAENTTASAEAETTQTEPETTIPETIPPETTLAETIPPTTTFAETTAVQTTVETVPETTMALTEPQTTAPTEQDTVIQIGTEYPFNLHYGDGSLVGVTINDIFYIENFKTKPTELSLIVHSPEPGYTIVVFDYKVREIKTSDGLHGSEVLRIVSPYGYVNSPDWIFTDEIAKITGRGLDGGYLGTDGVFSTYLYAYEIPTEAIINDTTLILSMNECNDKYNFSSSIIANRTAEYMD